MKGAFLVGKDELLFDTVKRVLLSLGGQVSADGEVAQLRDDIEGMFTIYRVAPESEWEFKTGALKSPPEVKLPDISDMQGIAIECRSESLFVSLVKKIAEACTCDLWVVDGNGVVWHAYDVNPGLVRL
jgi:hypothetical protein